MTLDPFSAIPPGQSLSCRLTVDKGGMKKLSGSYSFYLHLENTAGDKQLMILFCKKVKCFKGSKFLIYDNVVVDSDHAVGEVSVSSSGTHFKIYEFRDDHKVWCGEVHHSKNPMGIFGAKKMRINIPAMDKNNNRKIFSENNGDDNESITVVLKNKKPTWSDERQQNEIDFFGRGSEKSSKNFQLVTKTNDKYVIMQLCKFGDHYNLDISYPLCPLQAFSIALTMFVSTVNAI